MNLQDINNKNEINLQPFFVFLWREKLKIIFFVIISMLLGFLYSINKQNLYSFSVPIKLGNHTEFIYLTAINDILKKNDVYLTSINTNGYKIDSDSISEMFLSNFSDYQLLMDILQTQESVQKVIEDLNENQKQNKLLNIAKSFQISFDGKKGLISFEWQNIKEGKKIIKDTVADLLDNVKMTILSDLSNYSVYIFNRNEMELERLISELTIIEKERKLFDDVKINETSKLSFQEFNLKIVELKTKIQFLENSISNPPLSYSLNKISESDPFKWIAYNFSFSEIKQVNKMFLYLFISILLGIIFGIFYPIILNYYKNTFKKISN